MKIEIVATSAHWHGRSEVEKLPQKIMHIAREQREFMNFPSSKKNARAKEFIEGGLSRIKIENILIFHPT